MPDRKRRSQGELGSIRDHLLYELKMFFGCASAMASGVCHGGTIGNALLESFTVHARILLDFFYAGAPKSADEQPKPPQKDDVIAEDFFEDPAHWLSSRPTMTEELKKVHFRVGKEIAHLTYFRSRLADKNWPFAIIANDMHQVVAAFENVPTASADDHRKGLLNELIPRYSP